MLAASLHGQVPVFYTRDSHGAEERTRFFLSPLFLKKRVTSRNAKNCNEFNDFRFSMIFRAFHFFVLIFYNSIGILRVVVSRNPSDLDGSVVCGG